MIGIFGSDLDDFRFLIKKCKLIKRSSVGEAKILELSLNDCQFLCVATGYGKVNLGIAAGYVQCNYTLDMIIGIGNCGFIGNCGAKIGDVAIVTESVQYSVDLTAIGYPDTVIPGLKVSTYESSPKLTKVASSICERQHCKYICGKAATGEEFIADTDQRCYLREQYGSVFIDMECGSSSQIAYLFKLPCIFVKGISNYGNDRAACDFHKYSSMCNDLSCSLIYLMLLELL